MNFYYPSDMEARFMLGVWKIPTLILHAVLFTIAIFFFFYTQPTWLLFIRLLPMALCGASFVLNAQSEGSSIFEHMRLAVRFLLTEQRVYYWRQPEEVIRL